MTKLVRATKAAKAAKAQSGSVTAKNAVNSPSSNSRRSKLADTATAKGNKEDVDAAKALSNMHLFVSDTTVANVADTNVTSHDSDGTTTSHTEADSSVEVKPKRKGKKRGKKPAGFPRNALSAYNIFFREERKRMLDDLFEARRVAHDPDTSKIGFQQLAKTIGQKWKTLCLSERKPYIDEANADLVRYESEKEEFYKKATRDLYAADQED